MHGHKLANGESQTLAMNITVIVLYGYGFLVDASGEERALSTTGVTVRLRLLQEHRVGGAQLLRFKSSGCVLIGIRNHCETD